MANTTTKKPTSAEETVEQIEEKVTEKVKVEKTKDNAELEALKKQNNALQDQINALMQMVANLAGANNTSIHQNSLMDEVKVVHLVDRADGLGTHIQLTNMAIDFHAFGEERTLDRRQAEELAGKYRRWFERGIIAFGSGNEELAKRFALKSADEYGYVKSDFLGKLATMSVYELEDLYTRLCSGHKTFIIEYFKRKIIEKDPAFNDIHKIETLNRVSNGAMSDILLDRQRDAYNATK